MKDNQEKGTDAFIEKLLNNASVEEAPPGFTESVMRQLLAEEQTAVPQRPLIAAWVWYLLGGLACLLIILSMTDVLQIPDNTFGSQLDLGWTLPDLSGISLPEVSANLAYGLMAFSVFALLHLYWINGYIQKRFSH
ncbi:hypothetical protein ACT6NV_01350 [Robiginitalea sp. IMCC44478]|uniref:hypothetical protein n=1 Tax=Robiginitalea sp. IMCC44478 TaxID=3459122 RepID=UPI004040FD96